MPSITCESSLPMSNSNISINNSQIRKELDLICRRNQSIPPSTLRLTQTLAPVPEMNTPNSGPFENLDTELFNKENNTRTRLFQEFSNKKTMSVYDNRQQQIIPGNYILSSY